MSESIAMMWLHEMRGGYGYVEAVPALVVTTRAMPLVTGTFPRLTILVQKRGGEIVRRTVMSSNLRFCHGDELEQCRPVFDALALHWNGAQE